MQCWNRANAAQSMTYGVGGAVAGEFDTGRAAMLLTADRQAFNETLALAAKAKGGEFLSLRGGILLKPTMRSVIFVCEIEGRRFLPCERSQPACNTGKPCVG